MGHAGPLESDNGSEYEEDDDFEESEGDKKAEPVVVEKSAASGAKKEEEKVAESPTKILQPISSKQDKATDGKGPGKAEATAPKKGDATAAAGTGSEEKKTTVP